MQRIVSIVTAVAAAATLGLTGSAAFAAAPDVKPNRPVYLALGDSLAAGQAAIEPTGSFESTVRQWKARGFVGQFHEVLRDELDCTDPARGSGPDGCPRLQVVNLARTGIPGGPGGVTTATVLAPGDQLDRAVAILSDRNGNASPRDDVEVVSLTVGGNDLFGPAVAACVPTTPGTPPSPACAPTLATTFASFAASYETILSELREVAGDDVLLMTTTYYNPLPFCFIGAADPVGATALGNWVLEGGDIGFGPLPFGFNDIIRDLSAGYGAVVADTFGTIGAGDFVGGRDCTHPDASGHATIAEVFADAALPR